MVMISVPEAAERLGVSEGRVRQRINDGSLPADKIGGRWVVHVVGLGAVGDSRVGRPLAPHMAWAVLDVLAGQKPALRYPAERSRACKYAARLSDAKDPAPLLRSLLRHRGRREVFKAAPADLPDLREDERLRLSGVSADEGIVAEGLVEGYVAESDLQALLDDYFLLPAEPGEENIILHVAEDNRVQSWSRRMPKVVVAADLAEHRGSREDERVRDLVGCFNLFWSKDSESKAKS